MQETNKPIAQVSLRGMKIAPFLSAESDNRLE